ncbi:MAG TPA: molybdopterin-dependent oxidoreductase [Humibacter sp.]|nr:molybdopterin-dependent oxidoreductase [Humibacter sp.]
MTASVEPDASTRPASPPPADRHPRDEPGGGRTARMAHWLAAASGVLAALVTLAVAEIVAALVGAPSSPLFAVGSWIVDLAPPGFKEWIISVFGTDDKAMLFICLGGALLVVAALIGLLEFRRPPLGLIGLGVIAAIATLLVVTRSGATVWWAAPTLIGSIIGILALQAAIQRLNRWRAAEARPRRVPGDESVVARRSFLVFVGVSAGIAIVAGGIARAINAGSAAVTTVRESLRLPRPARPAAAVPGAADLRLPGLSPYVTPAADFYRIDTALQVPAVDPAHWKLTIGGMVEHPVSITFDELLALPLTEHMLTLACVSNDVGGDLVGNAAWLGYPIRELLARARPTSGADMVLSRSVDGWTAGTPLSVLTDPGTQALLAVGMNGNPLPLEHGFPVRMVVPGLYGYVSATKWVTELTVTRFSQAQGYWSDKGWSVLGPVKTASRIDRPRGGASIAAGRYAVAGVAWDQHTGIQRVEVRVDHADWVQAQLAETVSADTWRQWVYEWDATPGRHTLQVRATNAKGETQTGIEASPAPNGATGWHTIDVTVH